MTYLTSQHTEGTAGHLSGITAVYSYDRVMSFEEASAAIGIDGYALDCILETLIGIIAPIRRGRWWVWMYRFVRMGER